jgi:two-component system, chemotaxis family, chemotaxis protein CheY
MNIPGRITIIDDDSINNLFTKIIIKEAVGEGVDIRTFTHPRKAVEMIETEYAENPVKTILFLDINMPVFNGWEVLEQLENSSVDIKKYITIYMLSSSVDPIDKKRSKNSALVKGLVEKPLDVPKLREICGIIS